MPLPIIAKAITKHIAPRIARMNARWKLAEQVRRERRVLRSLDQRLLSDIGVSKREADREATRAAWDLPDARKPRYENHERDHSPTAINFLLAIRPGG